jgi:hypothetical protein
MINNDINDTTEVDVYCDLHRKVSSVKAITGPRKGHVIDKPREIVLESVTFRVSQAAVHKIRETGVRSVHAYARGRRKTLLPAEVKAMPDAIRVQYNPHLRGEFFDAANGEALTHLALFAVEGKTAWGVR